MNFYKLTSNLKDGISVLNHSSNKINLKVPLSSYHDEAQKFLEHLKSSENSDANEPSGLVPSQDQEIDSEEVGEKIIEQENLFVQSVHEMIMKAFYQATQYDIDGLIDLISFTESKALSMIRKECLEKILLADHNDPKALYSDRYLMIVADCLAGIYTFDTVRDYPKAISLYARVKEMDKGQSPYIENIAEKRIKCCELLNCTQLNSPSPELISEVHKMSQTDNFSRTVIACYYIAAPEIKSRENYESYKEDGYKQLINAVEENYRPAIALLEYLSQKGRIKGMSKKNVSEFRLRNNPPMSENNWYE